MSGGTLDQNAIREATLVKQIPRPDNDGTIKLFLTSTPNAPPAGPGFGYKTVRSKAQIYFYFDPVRFPDGRDNPQVASALQRLIEEMPRHPEKFCNCQPLNNQKELGDDVANPDMASLERRLETFHSWPRAEMNYHKLAQAGFFYAPIQGCPDRCIMFATGNALFNWDPDDDPWTEYKKWYPNCPYAKKKEAASGPHQGKSGSSYLSGIKNFFAGSSAKTGPQSPASSLQSELGRAWPAHIRDADPAQRWRKILEYEVARKKGGAAAAADKAAQQAHRHAEIAAAAGGNARHKLAEIEAGAKSAPNSAPPTPETADSRKPEAWAEGAVAPASEEDKEKSTPSTPSGSLGDAVDGWSLKAEKEEWQREKASFIAIRTKMGEDLLEMEEGIRQKRQELMEVEGYLTSAMDTFFARNAHALDQVEERVEKLASGYARVAQLIARSMDTAILQKEAGLDALARRAQQQVEQRERAEQELKRIHDKRRQEERELEVMRTVFKAKRIEMVRMSVATEEQLP